MNQRAGVLLRCTDWGEGGFRRRETDREQPVPSIQSGKAFCRPHLDEEAECCTAATSPLPLASPAGIKEQPHVEQIPNEDDDTSRRAQLLAGYCNGSLARAYAC